MTPILAALRPCLKFLMALKDFLCDKSHLSPIVVVIGSSQRCGFALAGVAWGSVISAEPEIGAYLVEYDLPQFRMCFAESFEIVQPSDSH